MQPVVVDSVIDLPNTTDPVTVSLEAKGVVFVAFAMELFLGTNPIKSIVKHASQHDLGKKFAAENAHTLLGLGFDCGGIVGAAVATNVDLHCEFHINGTKIASKIASIKLDAAQTHREFHLRCTFK